MHKVSCLFLIEFFLYEKKVKLLMTRINQLLVRSMDIFLIILCYHPFNIV